MILSIGIDDTDSREGMCTTYLGTLLLKEFTEKNFDVIGFPRLIRLNPNVPYKTRGNGAIRITLNVKESEIDRIKNIVINKTEEMSQKISNSGIAIIEGEVPRKVIELSRKALHKEVKVSEAKDIAKVEGIFLKSYGNDRGIIGALSSIGYQLEDKTFELLTYRKRENLGSPREVKKDSVFQMDEEYFPIIFDNVDKDEGDEVISPNGPDPVLFGIRGEDPLVLEEARPKIDSEDYDLYQVFETNQGTDDHLLEMSINDVEVYNSAIIDGEVDSKPKNIEGGHVFFNLSSEDGLIECAAYEPTKNFRKVIRKLRPGDKIKVYGGVNENKTLNLEKINIFDLEEKFEVLNPECPDCGRNMKSAGRNQGYRCRRCGTEASDNEVRRNKIERNIKEDIYEVPPMARRHLSKPLVRE